MTGALAAYSREGDRLIPLSANADPSAAVWIDLFAPGLAETEAMATLGIEIPDLDSMREIEISNRLYTANGALYMTAIVPGLDAEDRQISGPVTFILTSDRLVTVRFHRPRPFETIASRAGDLPAGCASSAAVFVGLIDEIIGRMADLIEEVGDALDRRNRVIYAETGSPDPADLRLSLALIGQQGERLNRVRLGLVTLERALSHFGQMHPRDLDVSELLAMTASQIHDIAALTEHANFLSGRIGLANDTTLGMINLRQSDTVRILSVVSTLFLPPTLIASLYGMNFAYMPELQAHWGYPAVILAMALSSVGTYLYFVWRGWL